MEETKEELKAFYEELNPAEFYRSIRRYQRRLDAEYFRKKGNISRAKLKIERGGLK